MLWIWFWITLKNLLLKCNSLGEELKYLFDNKRWFSCSRERRQMLHTLLDRACNIFKIRCILKKFGISSSSFWRLTIFKAWFSLLIYFYLLPQNYWMRKLPVLHSTDYHFWEHCLWIQDIQKWHLTAGCADSLALICHFQKRSVSQIFQHGRFVGQRVKAGYLWIEADNGHFITQTSLVLKLLFSRIRQITSSRDFDSINWNWL